MGPIGGLELITFTCHSPCTCGPGLPHHAMCHMLITLMDVDNYAYGLGKIEEISQGACGAKSKKSKWNHVLHPSWVRVSFM